jgi:hypothetical protein
MNGAIPEYWPVLPYSPNGWSANVLLADQLLRNAFEHTSHLLRQEDGDPIRLNLASDGLANDMVPILEQMEKEGIPHDFMHTCAHALGCLVFELRMASTAAEGMYVSFNSLLN